MNADGLCSILIMLRIVVDHKPGAPPVFVRTNKFGRYRAQEFQNYRLEFRLLDPS